MCVNSSAVKLLLKLTNTLRFCSQHQPVLHTGQCGEVTQSIVGFDPVEMVNDPTVRKILTIGLLPHGEMLAYPTCPDSFGMIWFIHHCITLMIYPLRPRSSKPRSPTSHLATLVGTVLTPDTLLQNEGFSAPETHESSLWVAFSCILWSWLPRRIVRAKLLMRLIGAGVGAKFRSTRPKDLGATVKCLTTIVAGSLNQLPLAHSTIEYTTTGVQCHI